LGNYLNASNPALIWSKIGAVIGKRFVLHMAFDTLDLQEKAIEVIKGKP
jgi:hypothetical protein